MAIPKPRVYWPFTVTASSNDKFQIRRTGAGADDTVTLTPQTIFTPETLRADLETKLNALGWGVFTVTLSATGFLTIANSAFGFTMKFGTGANAFTAPYNALGFYQVDLPSTANAVVAPRQIGNAWYSPVAVRSDTKEMIEEPNSVTTVTIGGQTKSLAEGELSVREVEFAFLTPEYTKQSSEGGAGTLQTAMERWWRSGRGRFRYWPDGTVEGTSGDYVLDGTVVADGFKPKRQFNGKELYTVGPWKFRRYTA